ncbi:universal stress protein [Algivirga pacifica]|uniref:Universal stress protein n=1 Tax=Algivirga pacifica TaxID=1162670 RepID=A0ABP9DAC8_9BACT
MKRILVPVDFSPLAHDAYSFATKIAKAFDSTIVLLRVTEVSADVLLNDEGDLASNNEVDVDKIREQRADNLKRLEDWKGESEVKVESVSIYGHSCSKSILQVIKQQGADLVIMGTEGNSGIKEIFTNSLTEYISIKSEVPVLSLKCNRDALAISEIVVVNDLKQLDQPLPYIKVMQEVLGAKVNLLKIERPSSTMTTEEVHQRAKHLMEHNEIEHFAVHMVSAYGVEEGVRKYIESNPETAIVAIATKSREGLAVLIDGCPSRDLVNHLEMPVYIFQDIHK